MEKEIKKYISTMELASLLGISRIAVFKKIKSGLIKAEKKGRNYLIDVKNIPGLDGKLSEANKKIINKAINKTIKDYEEALKLLAKE